MKYWLIVLFLSVMVLAATKEITQYNELNGCYYTKRYKYSVADTSWVVDTTFKTLKRCPGKKGSFITK